MEKEEMENIICCAKKVFCWYYIFGEDNDAAKSYLADLGNALQKANVLFKSIELIKS